MHVKGPEIPQHVGRRIGADRPRDFRHRPRETARRVLPFLFIDEAESILGTRRPSRHSNILSTLVPMFCSEMDGIDSLHDVVIILASNRADLIDPAILRPGRIDRKIKVNRPNRKGTRDIYRIYLTNDLPYDGALAKEAGKHRGGDRSLIERVVDGQFARREENKFLEVTIAERAKGSFVPERSAQRRDHRLGRRTGQGNGDQTFDRDKGRTRHQRERSTSGVRRRIYLSTQIFCRPTSWRIGSS